MNPQISTSIKGVSLGESAEVVLKVEALVDGKRSELEIAISTELAPLVALTLLETSVAARAKRDDLAPALEPVAVGVLPSNVAGTTRLHLLFEKGAVLPVEIKTDVAELLKVALQRELEGSPAAIQFKDTSP